LQDTLKGLDGLAPKGTVQSLIGQSWPPPFQRVEPRLGVIMNPYVPSNVSSNVALQLFVSEPFNNTIAIINLTISGTKPNQVFFLPPSSNNVSRITSTALNMPVDLAPTNIETENINWASNTTLEQGSDFYVANRGDNTIVRMKQDGTVVAIRRVTVGGSPLGGARLNGIATSADGTQIYATFTGPGEDQQGGLLQLPAFGG